MTTNNAMGCYILNARGEPEPCPNAHRWGQWMETAERHIGQTVIGDATVSTVFLGLDHNYSRTGRPILWETMVFGGALDGEQYRYQTRLEAARGHEAAVWRVREAQRSVGTPVSAGTRRIDLDEP